MFGKTTSIFIFMIYLHFLFYGSKRSFVLFFFPVIIIQKIMFCRIKKFGFVESYSKKLLSNYFQARSLMTRNVGLKTLKNSRLDAYTLHVRLQSRYRRMLSDSSSKRNFLTKKITANGDGKYYALRGI